MRTLAYVALALAIARDAAAQAPFAECLPPETTAVTIGAVECQLVPSAHLGADVPFSYFVPAACDPALHPGIRCPVVYLLHGTGGTYRSQLGPKGGTSPNWAKALTHTPPADPLTHPEPWTLQADTWVPADELPFVLVAPHNRTVPGGFGPAADMDGLWSDWNPRYAAGGDSPQYATPPPRFSSHLVEELLPFVEARLPVGDSRGWRATVGHSQGGFGALKFPLQYPDRFAASGSLSGGSLPFGRFLNLPDLGIGIQPPAPVPYVRLPGVTPLFDYPPESNYLVVPSLMPGYGDPVADHVYYVAEFPSGIASNGRAFEDGRQAIAIRLTVGDAIPRRVEDVTTDPPGYASSQGYEILTNVATREMARAFDVEGLDYEFLVRPGLHGAPYQAPYYRLMLEFLWRNLKHPDGSGAEVTRPDSFDYRTIRTSFEIWKWKFEIEREPIEFLNLTDVGCEGLTLRGTGKVTVTVPGFCHTGLDGERTFAIDLGPSQATDEPPLVGPYPVYGNTVHVTLQPHSSGGN